MPVQVTYPGVYIEEISSGAHTITGVATSITAFVGRAAQGLIEEPMTIFGFGDYEREFGGLSHDYPMSFAVQDFFLNGGSQAIIVRLYKTPAPPAPDTPPTPPPAPTPSKVTVKAKPDQPGTGTVDTPTADTTATVTIQPPSGIASVDLVVPLATLTPAATPAASAAATPADGSAPAAPDADAAAAPASLLTLHASSPGVWGNYLYAMADTDGITDKVAALYAEYGITQADLFNLTVYYATPNGKIATERFMNVSVLKGAGPRRLDRVLAGQSLYVRFDSEDVSTAAPAGWAASLTAWQAYYQANKSTRLDRLVPTLPRAAGGIDSDLLDGLTYLGSEDQKTGIYALAKADLFNLLCIPPDSLDPTEDGWNVPIDVYPEAIDYCTRRRAMMIIDSPSTWTDQFRQGKITEIDLGYLGNFGEEARNAAVYFPRVVKADPLLNGHLGVFAPCGIIAGVMARTDRERGVWKAPAGLDASLNGINGLEVKVTDPENGVLNPIGINCLRSFPVTGMVVWGARTMRGADQLADDYKYIPVRRLTLFIEESLYRGTQWAVFEPNGEPLWSSLRVNINDFMSDLSRQGAFYSYYVKCDKTTTTQSDIDRGIVNVVVAFAPVKPAEFVVLQIQQLAGQTA